MKVFCVNCRWHNWNGFFYLCNHKSNRFQRDTPLSREKRLDKTIEEKNKNNICKDYKKLWWLLWLS